ncbi:MAG: hypothetical protein WBE91_02415 [Steroidobacteraceae bacterium]
MGRRSLSTGCNAVSPRQYVDGPDQIGVRGKSTLDASELRLGQPVRRLRAAACGTFPTGIMWRHGDEDAPVPRHFVVELTAKLGPPLIEDRAIQARFGQDPSTRIGNRCRARFGQVPHLQVLEANHRVAFADGSRDLVQVVATAVFDPGVNLLQPPSGLLPVFAELASSAHHPLIVSEPLLVPPEAMERLIHRAIRERGEAYYSDIDADGTGRTWYGWFNLA